MIDGRRRHRPDRVATVETGSPRRRTLSGWLVAHNVSANAVTLAGVLLAALTAAVLGLGWFYVGAGLLIVGGLMDTLDGAVAKAAGTSSPRGAFVDSVADRVGDALIFGGVAWHLLLGRDPRAAMVPVAILAVSSVISYERAKAESLGLSAKGGLMERAERLIFFGLALVLNVVLVPMLLALLGLSCATALGRFLRIWQQASEGPSRRPQREFVRVGVESRWRMWRETGRVTLARRPRRERQALTVRLRRVIGPTGSGPRTGSGRTRSVRAGQRRLERER